jgi:hypothetical protein
MAYSSFDLTAGLGPAMLFTLFVVGLFYLCVVRRGWSLRRTAAPCQAGVHVHYSLGKSGNLAVACEIVGMLPKRGLAVTAVQARCRRCCNLQHLMLFLSV